MAYNDAGNGKYSAPITVTTAEGGESVQCLFGRGGMVLNERERERERLLVGNLVPRVLVFFGQRVSTERVCTISRAIESIIKATMYRNNISMGEYGYIR